MLSEIDNLTSELRTEKVLIRTKAFAKLNEILTSRYSELQKAMSNDTDNVSWEFLFIAAHQGVLMQSQKLVHEDAQPNENDSKIANYSKVMLKLSDCISNVPHKVLVSLVCEVLREEGHRTYFGKCYLQVLQKACLKTNTDLTLVDLKLWIELLEILFKLLKSKRHQIPFIETVTSTQLAIEYGCSFSHLSTDLVNYLPVLESLLEKRVESREKLELLIVAYHCCYNIAVDHRLEVCRFTETISKHIHTVFKVDLNEESKEKLFRLMDLSLIVHYPMLDGDAVKLKYVNDVALWNSQLRNFAYIVDLELKPTPKTKYRSTTKLNINQVLVQFAARLSYLVYWDELVWQVDKNEEPTTSKRQRRSTKLQALIDLVTPNQEQAEFNWKWLVVTAEVIYNYPASLQNEDYQVLLQAISQFQATMEGEIQVYAFTKCCFVLLEREPKFLATANAIIANLCKEFWNKIADGTARVCSLNNKNSIENHIALQVLIHHHKYPSNSFIENIINIFLSNSTIKCDATLQTLVTILSSFNLDTLPNGKNLLEKIIKYTFEKPSLANLKKVITTTGKEKPSAHMLAKVGVICCLSQTDFVNFSKKSQLNKNELFTNNWNIKVQEAYKKDIFRISHYILVKHNERLLIEEVDFKQRDTAALINATKEHIPTEIKCIIEPLCFEILQSETNFKSKVIDEGNDTERIKDYLLQVLENNEIMMSLVDCFLTFEAFNDEKLKGSFILKKVDYHLQEIERLFKLILKKRTNLEMRDTHELLLLVKSMFSRNLHQAICSKVRTFDLTSCIKWVSNQADHNFSSSVGDAQLMNIGPNEFLEAKLDEKMKFLAIATLFEYNNLPGQNTDLLKELITEIELDPDDNMDLHSIFHAIKVLGSQPIKDIEIVKWLWGYIVQICKYHHNNQYVSKQMIESFENILSFTKSFSEMASNVISLYSSFAQICCKPQYSSSVSVEFIRQFKVFHQNYFSCFDETPVTRMYQFLQQNFFLKSEIIEIKMEAIKTIAFVLSSDIEQQEDLRKARAARSSQDIIFNDLFEEKKVANIGYEMETQNENIDEHINEIADFVQLYSSLFCANFVLRKPIIFELSKVVLHFQLSEEIATNIFAKVLKFLECDAGSLMDHSNIDDLLSRWFALDYPLQSFPWFFTGATSINDFLSETFERVLMAMLKNRPAAIEQFFNLLEVEAKSSILSVLPNCYAYFVPVLAGCTEVKFEAKAVEMKRKIGKYFTDNEQLSLLLRNVSLVIGFVLENVYDSKKFNEICGFELGFLENPLMIDCINFDKCLRYLREKFVMPEHQSILTFFCDNPNFRHFAEKLLLIQKKKIQSTRLKEHKILYFFQYCVLVEKLSDYLVDPKISSSQNIKAYLVREITSFLGFLIADETYGLRLRETALSFQSRFLRKILPCCAEDVKPFLNKIVSSLVSLSKHFKDQPTKLEQTSISIINFLVIDQAYELKDEIANLDRFPDNAAFKTLLEKQLAAKYSLGSFTLDEEIEHFLKNKKRKVEGLIALRKHLAQNKKELKTMFDALTETLGFSEDGETSLLHRLIRQLIAYARNNVDDEERAVESIKCLGEIGNFDLSTMVFIAEDHHSSSIYQKIDDFNHCQRLVCKIALEQLETMVLHPIPRVFEAASSACYHILELKPVQQYKPSVYLRPYQTNTVSDMLLFYMTPKKDKVLDFVKFVKEIKYSSYKTWIKRLTGLVLAFCGDRRLEQVSSVQKTFAEKIFPLMVQLLLIYNQSHINEEINSGVNLFFDESAKQLNHLTTNEGSIFINKQAIRQMLDLVECIRMHCLDHPDSDISNTIELNYLNIAKAAKHCEAFFTAVLYCELWAQIRFERESIPYEDSIEQKIFQEIMYTSYKAIGINDAFDLFISPVSQRSLYLQVSGQHWQNVLEHDVTEGADKSEAYVKLLSESGLHFLANQITPQSDQKKNSNHYECLWRMCNWDALIESDVESSSAKGATDLRADFEKFHYSGLKCLKTGDELGYKIAMFKGRKSILHLLQQESLECTKNINKFLGMAHLLQQIDDFAHVRFNRVTGSHLELLEKWEAQNQFPHNFELIEPILNQRNSIFDTANIKTGKRTWIPEALQMNMLHVVKEAIEAGCNSDAIKTTAQLRALPNLTSACKAEMLMKEAELNFNGNMKFAKNCLKRILDEKEFEQESLTRCVALRVHGEILAEHNAEEMKKIHKEYFLKSISYLERYARRHKKVHLVPDVDYSQVSQELSQEIRNNLGDKIDQKIKENVCVFDIVAKYHDREYISKSEYILSPDFQNKVKTLARNEEKLIKFSALFKNDKGNKDVHKSVIILERSIQIDKAEIESAEDLKKKAAGHAMIFYLRGAINSSNDNDLSIFRIISIWLSNLEYTTIKQMLEVTLKKIPSYKFLVALPQLVVRLNEKENDYSNELLKKLILRCALDHPYHALPLILSLVNSYADSPTGSDHKDEPRVIGAKMLWQLLSREPGLPQGMISQLEMVSSALISLANKECVQIPTNHQLRLLKNLSNVQCPTVEIPIQKDCNIYRKSITSIVKWSSQIESVGGINAPKKIYCVCSDGVKRPQLLKGLDDMRQDAVMQQVFNVVNQLLKQNKETKKRHACVRTYKVVPLSRRSGILEWCDNTVPIGNYLVGDRKDARGRPQKGAHQRYYPQDWSPDKCRKELAEADKAQLSEKEKKFKEICQNLHPAFHHFFYENYKEPGKLFERRLAYTTSVAVSSMVGYILGIGDRHVQNILIDYKSAEVIHIDFGIAFEQGKILPHKELIPFRLTRDMIAPMGVCGVDGVFRKTCEKTLEILRKNDKTLLTILEVLLYDPMYAWTLSAKKALKKQLAGEEVPNDILMSDDSNEEEKDSMANRALLRVAAKLKGQADDSLEYTSVEGHVTRLIQQAMSPSLLSRLFIGWQAYL